MTLRGMPIERGTHGCSRLRCRRVVPSATSACNPGSPSRRVGLLNRRPHLASARPCETRPSAIEVSGTTTIEPSGSAAGAAASSAAAAEMTAPRKGAAKSGAAASAAVTSRQRDRTEANQSQAYYAKYSLCFHVFTLALVLPRCDCAFAGFSNATEELPFTPSSG